MLKTGYRVEKILSPKSIAVIGASGDTSKANFTGATGILANLYNTGYDGNIYPVNPKYDSIFNFRCYPSVLELPEPVDLLVVGIARDQVMPVLTQAAERGVGGCIIITSGFGEDEREENKYLQDQMTQLCQTSGMRVCGPNCLGIGNVHGNVIVISSVGLNAGPLDAGGVALISQSGALVSSMLTNAKDKGISFSYVISSGNDADLELADYIHYLAGDSNTKVIAAYIEGIRDPEKLKEAFLLCQKNNKPVVVFKVGRSSKGAIAAQAHTGAIASSDVVINSMFEKYGVLRVNSLDNLLEISQALSLNNTVCSETRLGVITVSGGTGSILADLSEDLGISIPDLMPSTADKLRSFLPSYTSIKNPIDVTAGITREPQNLLRTMQVLQDDPNIDVIYVSLTAAPPSFEVDAVDAIAEFQQTCKKTTVVGWYSGSLNWEGKKRLQRVGVPCFTSLEASLLYVRRLAQNHSADNRSENILYSLPPETIAIPEGLKGQSGILNEYESKQILKQYGLSVVKEVNVSSVADAVNFAEKIGFPVVLKINSKDIPHKTEAGCVTLGIQNAQELEKCYSEILNNAYKFNPNAKINGVLVQETVVGQECIIGVKSDERYGPVLMFGLGGIAVELLRDVTFKMAPVSREEALDMIHSIKAFRLLDGYRNQPKADVEALADALQKVGQIAYSLRGCLKELDINPIMVMENGLGAKVVDALIVL